jgi:Lar family restriction alleviation protein
MTDLKPCPFCGGEKVEIKGAYVRHAFIECCKCGIAMVAGESKAEAIAAWNRRADGWIPVTERLPEEDNEEYLTCYATKDGIGVPTIRTYIQGRWYADCEYVGRSKGLVTHWMPLPQPPAKGEE